MPVQTRAAGQPQTSKVYKPKAPEPKQQHFPSRRRHIKTYGRRTAPKRLDQTLTQMNFVSSAAQEEVELLVSSDEDSEEAEDVPPVPKKAAKKKPRQKPTRTNRRRTTGDVEEEEDEENEKPRSNKRRKTLGDAPASSSFHTQTLTQFLSNTSNIEDEDEENWKIADSDGEELGLIKETPKKVKAAGLGLAPIQLANAKSVTPSNRQTKLEIPSSQSPATPLLLRYSPAKEPSPLKNKSTNVAASQSNRKSVSRTPRNFIIQDSYSTTHSSPVTPTPKANAKAHAGPQVTVTPAKQLRFELPEDKENITPGRTKPKSPKPVPPRSSHRKPLSEVPDSDDELEETENEDDSTDASVTAGSEHVAVARNTEGDIIIPSDPEEENLADARYVAGTETQALLTSSGDRLSLELGSRNTPKILPGDDVNSRRRTVHNRKPLEETPSTQGSTDEIVEQTPTGTPHKLPKDDAATQDLEEYTQGFTQGMESQRVPLETIKATGPITDKSDIIVSIYGEHVENITKRIKTHEFRDWKFPQTVHRVWIYITRPASQLKYMCIFGPPKTPGEVHEDGLGNAEFNRGMKRSKFAYEVLEIYELNNPVSLQVMKQNGWPAAPQKFAYVPPAVVGQLTSNLRCSLWGEDAEQDNVHSSPNVTESQELAEQIRSDIDRATQLVSSDQIEVVPSSQSPTPRAARKRASPRGGSHFVRPAIPKSSSASSPHSLPTARGQRSRYVRPSQASTISQVSSSPVASPEKSMAFPLTSGAQRSAPARLPDTSSPTSHRQSHHSLRSSQFPTKSQMLPDSLLNNDIQEPPPIIWDSADDESD
ncbi:hypothetical protein SUNI508_12033 [Seiridium unicorne]|uniref:Uncharacterized protein n=1 Tax=Seiridium unicorne TaxID=138068 RepID=A0ABR2UEW5_9PEZI